MNNTQWSSTSQPSCLLLIRLLTDCVWQSLGVEETLHVNYYIHPRMWNSTGIFQKNTHWPQAALKNYKVRYVQIMAGRPQTQLFHSTLNLVSGRIPQICYFPISSYFIHLFFSHKVHSNHHFSSIHYSKFPLPSLSP